MDSGDYFLADNHFLGISLAEFSHSRRVQVFRLIFPTLYTLEFRLINYSFPSSWQSASFAHSFRPTKFHFINLLIWTNGFYFGALSWALTIRWQCFLRFILFGRRFSFNTLQMDFSLLYCFLFIFCLVFVYPLFVFLSHIIHVVNTSNEQWQIHSAYGCVSVHVRNFVHISQSSFAFCSSKHCYNRPHTAYSSHQPIQTHTHSHSFLVDCSVDDETWNWDAFASWSKHYRIVGSSLRRIMPEKIYKFENHISIQPCQRTLATNFNFIVCATRCYWLQWASDFNAVRVFVSRGWVVAAMVLLLPQLLFARSMSFPFMD